MLVTLYRALSWGLIASFLTIAAATFGAWWFHGLIADVLGWPLLIGFLGYVGCCISLTLVLAGDGGQATPFKTRLAPIGLLAFLGASPWLAVFTSFWGDSIVWPWPYLIGVPGMTLMSLAAVIGIVRLLMQPPRKPADRIAV